MNGPPKLLTCWLPICPFTANYMAAPLSETLAIFCTAHCLYYGVRGLKALSAGEPAGRLWCIGGVWAGAALLIRPDDGIILRCTSDMAHDIASFRDPVSKRE